MFKNLLFKTGLAIWLPLLVLTGCGEESVEDVPNQMKKIYTWKMVTTWPKNFPGLGTIANELAENIETMSGGQLKIKVYAAGELVPAMQVFDAVKGGAAEMGHSASYYWKGKIPAAQFFTSLPFGMNAQETNAWFYYGGGIELWHEIYKPFGLLAYPGGNTGVQMAGWFKKEINSLNDLQGLKMRIPGMGAEVMSELGVVPVQLPGGEVFSSMQSGAIDAADWVGPYNDEAFGLHKTAPYYYMTGWQEPGAAVEFIVNEKAFKQLPEHLQKMVEVAFEAANARMLALYTAENKQSLHSLINKGVNIKKFPDDVIAAMQTANKKVIARLLAEDEQTQKIFKSYRDFLLKVRDYHDLTEFDYYNNRRAMDWEIQPANE
ncbi:TRAP transporter substrate-binding protein [Gayadomonas joobiniege]|uniref:TRAP transporter substrate-binding protein n=1 Tax=Gayadomonas joobiniege TaxID=1234606 RepID=UPI00037EE760|nr:TRAP transporter substrate-binding protein DctP [Gayadomonas joobiniege]